MKNPPRWDIFCAVIDNLGDIGVTWRLARQLAAEFGLAVRLWVDDLAALRQIWPAAAIVDRQWLAGVEVCRWPDAAATFAPAELPDVVIEAFACSPPPGYLAAMATAGTLPRAAPVWINLEYLSAEPWVEECHGLVSQVGTLQRTFFFPGFTDRTGGLLRETDLLRQRDRWLADDAEAFQRRCGIRRQPGERLLSLFSYETATLDSLLAALRETHGWRLLVPDGRALAALETALGRSLPPAGETFVDAALHIQRIGFLRQDDYDHLLRCCDFNIVRGEDSFLRAQWAARPLLWHIYPQADDAHWPKLTAFLQRYLAGLPPDTAALLERCWCDWNAGAAAPLAALLEPPRLAELAVHAEVWARELAAAPDLASQLVHFCATKALQV